MMNPTIIVSNGVCGKCHIRLLTRRLTSNCMIFCIIPLDGIFVMQKRITRFFRSATSPWVHCSSKTTLAPKMLDSPGCGTIKICAFFNENRPISNLATILNYCDLIISHIIWCINKPGPGSCNRFLHFPSGNCVFMQCATVEGPTIRSIFTFKSHDRICPLTLSDRRSSDPGHFLLTNSLMLLWRSG